jgi:tetratricopeptide (TPR) repeat protein
MAAYMMGQADVARVALERATKSNVDFPGKDEAQRRLASLQTGSAHPEKRESSDLLALTRRAEDLEKKGQTTQAAQAYEEALRLNPKLGNLALKLAQLYAGPLQDRDKALEFAKRARALAPNDPNVSVVLGRIAVESGNFSWAYSLLQEGARKGASDPVVLHDFAVAAYALGKVPEARQSMQRVVDLDPNSARADEAKRFLSMTPLDQTSPEAVTAQPEVEKILKAQPDYVPALMAQAAIQLQRNDRAAATEIYAKILQKYPDFGPAQKRLAAIYVENPSNLVKAYDLAIKARKNLPDDADLALTLAEISYQRKEFPYAIQLFIESAAKQPLAAKDLFYLGMAQLQARQAANGRETLDRALKAGLSGSLAAEAKKRLAEEQPK